MKSVKLIATDLDGTLFYPKKRSHMVTKENRAFIHRFVGDGGRILLVTGRNAYFGEKVVEAEKPEGESAEEEPAPKPPV